MRLDGALRDFNFAALRRGAKDLVSTQFFLSPVPNVTYSACLVSKIEEMFETGHSAVSPRIGPAGMDPGPSNGRACRTRIAASRLFRGTGSPEMLGDGPFREDPPVDYAGTFGQSENGTT